MKEKDAKTSSTRTKNTKSVKKTIGNDANKKIIPKNDAVVEKLVEVGDKPVSISVPNGAENQTASTNINLTINLACEEKKKRTTTPLQTMKQSTGKFVKFVAKNFHTFHTPTPTVATPLATIVALNER